MTAAINGHIDCLKVLLKAGVDTDSIVYKNKTALMWATEKGHSNCVEVLRKACALK